LPRALSRSGNACIPLQLPQSRPCGPCQLPIPRERPSRRLGHACSEFRAKGPAAGWDTRAQTEGAPRKGRAEQRPPRRRPRASLRQKSPAFEAYFVRKVPRDFCLLSSTPHPTSLRSAAFPSRGRLAECAGLWLPLEGKLSAARLTDEVVNGCHVASLLATIAASQKKLLS